MRSPPGLGTMLRHLIEHLDGAVEEAYRVAGLDYRPRYTPVVRVLVELGDASLREIADAAGMTHSAVSQTVAQMQRVQLVESVAGIDLRQNVVRLTAKTKAMLPKLRSIWLATNAAADGLDAELTYPLTSLLGEAIAALDSRSFGDRIRAQPHVSKVNRRTA